MSTKVLKIESELLNNLSQEKMETLNIMLEAFLKSLDISQVVRDSFTVKTSVANAMEAFVQIGDNVNKFLGVIELNDLKKLAKVKIELMTMQSESMLAEMKKDTTNEAVAIKAELELLKIEKSKEIKTISNLKKEGFDIRQEVAKLSNNRKALLWQNKKVAERKAKIDQQVKLGDTKAAEVLLKVSNELTT